MQYIQITKTYPR